MADNLDRTTDTADIGQPEISICVREAAKKSFFLVAGPLRGGGAKRVCQ